MKSAVLPFLMALPFLCSAAMPPAEQNALVRQYCAVCHTDSARNGGLSLEHYDAGKRDPGLAAMMLSKLKNGAMGAAGNGVPSRTAQEAWLQSTAEQAAGAEEWFVSKDGDTVSAGVVRAASRNAGASAELYRLLLTCNPSTGIGEIALTWSPEPQTGRDMSVSFDDGVPAEYRVAGKESMGNGSAVQTGRSSAVLRASEQGKLLLPKGSLTVAELFPGETVRFPLQGLDAVARSRLSSCFK